MPENLVVATDPRILGGALLALIRRAELLTPSDEHIDLHFDQEENNIRISLHDPASYVDASDIELLTDPFGPSRERLYFSSNSGLELVLAQHALQHIGSKLDISSRKGEGTTVTCVLPGGDLSAPTLNGRDVERELDMLHLYS